MSCKYIAQPQGVPIAHDDGVKQFCEKEQKLIFTVK